MNRCSGIRLHTVSLGAAMVPVRRQSLHPPLRQPALPYGTSDAWEVLLASCYLNSHSENADTKVKLFVCNFRCSWKLTRSAGAVMSSSVILTRKSLEESLKTRRDLAPSSIHFVSNESCRSSHTAAKSKIERCVQAYKGFRSCAKRTCSNALSLYQAATWLVPVNNWDLMYSLAS